MTPSTTLFDHFVRHQYGLVTNPQLTDLGWTRHQLEHALRVGRLVRVHPGVYRTIGSPICYRQRLLAACLASGRYAVVSHRAAAHLWGLEVKQGPVEITVPYAKSPSLRGVRIHRSTDLVPQHTTARDRIPVTNPLRLLVDVGAVVPLAELATIVDAAVLEGLVTFPDIHAMVEVVAQRGRRGIGPLRTVLRDRPLGDARPERVLEPVMMRILHEHGIGGAVYQQVVKVGGHVFRIDIGIPHVKLGLEVDGLKWHGTRAAAIRDRERRRLLRAAGWELMEFTATDLRRRPARCASEILGEIAARERLLAALGLPV